MSPRPLLFVLALAAPWLAACIADAREPAAPGGSWPPVWQGPAPRGDFGMPRFEPPSAEDCHRLPALRELPGREGRQDDEPRPMSAIGESRALRRLAPDGVPAPAAAPPVADRAVPAPFSSPKVPSPEFPSPERRKSAAAERAEPVTAGMVDDNADFGGYQAYRRRHPGLSVRDRDIGERYLLEVTDAQGRAVPDAEVAVQAANTSEPLMRARTDTAGRVWLHPRAFLPPDHASDNQLGIAARRGAWQGRAVLRRGQAQAVALQLGGAVAALPSRLDLVFLVDATGSMGDEIAKLKASMQAMSRQIAQLPTRPDICWGLVAYRDHGDAFLTRTADFTDRLPAFQEQLSRLQAGGGGDTPEALNEALHETVHGLAWRRDAVRLVVLVGDAPPHLDYGGPQYDVDMQAALGKGIKLFAVGASGLDETGEYVFRQLAQYTGGRFVFLTYRDAARPGSGPGEETVHDVSGYSVQTLDRLVVRLVGEELRPLARP